MLSSTILGCLKIEESVQRKVLWHSMFFRFPVAYVRRLYFLFLSIFKFLFLFFIIRVESYLGVHISFRNIVRLKVYCFYLVRHKIDEFSHQRPKIHQKFSILVCCDNLLLRSRKCRRLSHTYIWRTLLYFDSLIYCSMHICFFLRICETKD